MPEAEKELDQMSSDNMETNGVVNDFHLLLAEVRPFFDL